MNSIALIIGTARTGSLEQSYARAFRHLGWRVETWEPERELASAARGGALGRMLSTFLGVEPWRRKANVSLLRFARAIQPSLVLVIGTTGVRAGTLAQLKVLAPGTHLCCMYPDSPHNLDVERISCLPIFDLVAASSPDWVDAFARLGAKRAEYLPFAADTFLHKPASAVHDRAIVPREITFIGAWRPEREAMLEEFITFDLAIWGSRYWKDRTRRGSPLKKRWGRRELIGDEFAAACATSKVMLNILDSISWPGPNMRCFEQPACRGFSLVSRTAPILEIFKEGNTIECFDTVDEARDKIRFYLTHESQRIKIARQAHDLIMGGHSYVDRAKTIIKWMSIREHVDQR